jgi:hypothetical protein
MKKYFIDGFITYCYPYDIEKGTKDYGVLSKYIGKYFNRDEMDKIICELIMKHPYVENSMWLKLSVQWIEENITGYYHILNFRNDNYEKQSKASLEIKYEK